MADQGMRIPIFSTIIVVAAVATMIALGFWQLDRADEKAALLAQYADAQASEDEILWPRNEQEVEGALYRRSRLDCESVQGVAGVSGTSARGAKGWAHRATCTIPGGGEAEVALGWSVRPESPVWDGGEVTGRIAPGPRLVADPPVAGLEPLAPPDPSDVPNNHLAYTGQWFFFALTAAVIYFLALRRRRKSA